MTINLFISRLLRYVGNHPNRVFCGYIEVFKNVKNLL